eukprot:scaffold7611_cov145-Skeletonema_menzelii.AAC.5
MPTSSAAVEMNLCCGFHPLRSSIHLTIKAKRVMQPQGKSKSEKWVPTARLLGFQRMTTRKEVKTQVNG